MAEDKIRVLVRYPGDAGMKELECDVILGINMPEKGEPMVVTIGQYDNALVILGAIGAYFTLKSRNRSPLFLLMCLADPLGWVFIWYLPTAPAREANSMQKYLEKNGVRLS